MCIRIPTALLLVLVCGSASAATDGPYCMFVVAPKVAKLRKEHLDRLRA